MSITDPPMDDNVELPAPVVVSTEPVLTRVPAAPPDRRFGPIRWIGILVIVAGGILLVSGVVTWIVVQTQLADENITVSDDAARFEGEEVDGPLTAYAQADVIEKHALEASGGLTYAELPRDDPVRETVMDASFLRASLFTSVVAFGVAVMAMGLGVLFIVVGIILVVLASRLAKPAPTSPLATEMVIPAAPA
ncbi:MAG TPA: hypothetical protein VFO97_09515 [Desertimonas sp.]|nr:hypothetical protein [Desertimonas sp.]